MPSAGSSRGGASARDSSVSLETLARSTRKALADVDELDKAIAKARKVHQQQGEVLADVSDALGGLRTVLEENGLGLASMVARRDRQEDTAAARGRRQSPSPRGPRAGLPPWPRAGPRLVLQGAAQGGGSQGAGLRPQGS